MCIIFAAEIKFLSLMARPKNERIVSEPPIYGEFKPVGIQKKDLDEIILSIDEYEAIRLANYVGLSHEEASMEMKISRSTFSRLLEVANKKLAEFIIKGKILNIDGGSIHFKKNIIQCRNCGHMFRTSIVESTNSCPNCNSTNLLNLAGGFGHGRCCNEHNFKN